jgi:hypothetical protein
MMIGGVLSGGGCGDGFWRLGTGLGMIWFVVLDCVFAGLDGEALW